MADSSSHSPAFALRVRLLRLVQHDQARVSRFGDALRLEALAARGTALGLWRRRGRADGPYCAKAAHEGGGEVLGIMPRFLERREITLR